MLFHALVTAVRNKWQPAEFFVRLPEILIDPKSYKELRISMKNVLYFRILGSKSGFIYLASCHSLSQYNVILVVFRLYTTLPPRTCI